MANQEIIGGLKSALERGYSLEQAMLSLLNSGYNREEIKEAARNLGDFRPEPLTEEKTANKPETPKKIQMPPTSSPVKINPQSARSFQELQNALDRGYSLKQAMLALFNEGYTQREIEQAVRTLSRSKIDNLVLPLPKTEPQKKKIEKKEEPMPKEKKSFLGLFHKKEKENAPKKLLSLPEAPKIPKTSSLEEMKESMKKAPVQKVSNYEPQKTKENSGSRGTGMIILLTLFLLMLIGALVSIFIFREQLVDFLNSFFS